MFKKINLLVWSRYLAGATIGLSTLLAMPALASAATLSLSPTSGSFAAGVTFEVKILVDTSGATTSGTDVYLTFDPNALQVIDSVPGTTGTQILQGSLYSQTPANLVDNGVGKISFSGAKSSGSSPGYSGTGTLATITFQAVTQTSASKVAFNYTKGSTTDSNVIDQTSHADLLTAVTNGSYDIGAAAVSTTTSTTAGTTGTNGATGNDTEDASLTTGASGQSGTSGSGGTSTVQATGIDLGGYMTVTVLAFVGALFFLTRRPKRS